MFDVAGTGKTTFIRMLAGKLSPDSEGRICAPCTVNSLYCGHLLDRELVSLIARVRNSGNLVQSNVCNLFLPGI